MKRRNIVLVAALTACATLFLASCDNKPTVPPTPAAQTTPEGIIVNPSPVASPDEKSGKKTTIYKVGSKPDGMAQLEPVEIDMDPTKQINAVLALNAMADEENSPLPEGTQALSISFDADKSLATVSFSPELEKNFEGGDTREALMFNSILATIGQFGDVKRVQILVDGKKVAIGGTQDTTQPLDIPSDPNAAPKSER